MYNFIVSGAEDAWESSYYEYPRDRFLEYTNERIRSEFKELNQAVIQKLCSIPTLFMYELQVEKPGKIGRIKDISVGPYGIGISFEFNPQFSPVSWERLRDFEAALGITRYERNRTHWAIKESDIFEDCDAFERVPEIVPSVEQKIAVVSGSDASVVSYVQRILFGPPGTGKSFRIRNHILTSLGIEPELLIESVFHPEYSYGDFIGKLLPLTVKNADAPGGSSITYQFYPGHLLQALSHAYRELVLKPNGRPRNVALTIDEINRGNCAAIFGSSFQLLDREDDGFSSYGVRLSKMEAKSLRELSGLDAHAVGSGEHSREAEKVLSLLDNDTVKLPPNLSIVASMNTSDESIYYMDSAFKRRWDWEYIRVDDRASAADLVGVTLYDDIGASKAIQVVGLFWLDIVDALNAFLVSQKDAIRRIEDKQIGYRFIKPVTINTERRIPLSALRSKLLFFLWDSVFPRDRRPLETGLGLRTMTTFADFSDQVVEAITALAARKWERMESQS